MLRQIVEEEFPLRDAPKSGHLVIVKANHEGGNQIEFLIKVWKPMKRLDSLNNAANSEHARDFPEHWQAIHVEADSGMTEELRDVQEVSCATAQIENLPRARQVELKLVNPSEVNFNPAIEIEIFWPVRAGICYHISLAYLLETDRIDCLDDALCLQLQTFGS